MAYKPITQEYRASDTYNSRGTLKSAIAATTIASLLAPTAAMATTPNLESRANVPGLNIQMGNTTSPYLPNGAINEQAIRSMSMDQLIKFAAEQYGIKIAKEKEQGKYMVAIPQQGGNSGNNENGESHALRYIVIGGLAAAAVIGIIAATSGGGGDNRRGPGGDI